MINQKLKIIIDILNSLNINWWLDFGQLLSLHRDKKFLDWIDDFDFCIELKNEDFNSIINELQEQDFIIKHKNINKFIQIKHKDLNTHIDFYFCKRNNQTKFMENLFFNIHKDKGYQMPLFFYESFDCIEIDNLKFKVPKNLDNYLEIRYGKLWHIPIKKDMSKVYDNINNVKDSYSVLVAGVFDYLHIGHTNLIDKAIKNIHKVVVGVHSDSDVKSYKTAPTNTMLDRIKKIKEHYPNLKIIENCPLVTDEKFLKSNNIDFVMFGNEKSKNINRFYPSKKCNFIVDRTPNISSTLIKNNYKENKQPIIIGICGMVRSGSTYQFNVVRKTLELNGYKVTFSKDDDADEKLKLPTDIHLIKVHHYNQKIKNTCDFIFTTERDFEQARKSLELLHNKTYDNLDEYRLHLLMWKKFTNLHQYYNDFRTNKFNVVKEIVLKLEELLQLKNKVSIEEIIKEVDAIKPTEKWFDENTYLHNNHIKNKF